MRSTYVLRGLGPVVQSLMHWREIITVEPDKRGGKPCIRGMRVTVSDVLDSLASGMTAEEIVDELPYVTLADIRACLSFAADRERRLVAPVE
jgi:uncharacterized protein (DUF433 family)